MARFHTKAVRDEVGTQTGQENVAFTQAEEDAQDAHEAAELLLQPVRDIQDQIATLEATATPRRIREAASDPTWMNALDAEIAVLRGQL